MASISSFCAPQKASNHDEIFMQQSLIFSDTLKDLKNLRKQLYSAADVFEVSYRKQNQKQIVVETLKDYATIALINAVDHLGSVAFKVSNLLDEKIGEISETERRFICLEQRVKSHQEFINRAALSQQSSVMLTPTHHKRYIYPDEDIGDDFGKSSEEEEPYQFTSAAQPSPRTRTMETPSLHIRRMFSTLQSKQCQWNPKQDRGAASASPLHFSGSLLKRSPSPSYSRYPSEPRRSVTSSTFAVQNRRKEFEKHSTKSKRLLKTLLSNSMLKPKKE